jgi:hypothetical protein
MLDHELNTYNIKDEAIVSSRVEYDEYKERKKKNIA